MKKDITIKSKASIKEALKKLDKTAEKTLLVVDENNKLLGTITDGDIRRYIIKTGNLEGDIHRIFNKNPIFVLENALAEENIKEIFLNRRIELLPIINSEGKIAGYITWSDVFSEKERIRAREVKSIDVPVVIMAGGKGTRLKPFTHVLPKPLIPVGEKTILEHIIETFKNYGVKKFFITLNYKGEMIEAYFKGFEKDYEIEFVWEEEFLGTAGSLRFLAGKIKDDFFVSNCDVVLKADYADILGFHKKQNAVFTSITSIKNYRIPYGVVKTKENGVVDRIEEKPEFTFQINTGVYLLSSKVLNIIPEGYYDMPDLINNLLSKGEKVIAYPINENDYIDIGQWDDYKKNWLKLSVF